ncbi:lysine--tRNA ligase [Corallococcus sp. H22C18031201]|uniref:lysine--tRNA ligase n=1 Tax=Citreicoccus inhibens TaxID=2849499 RepID=UPI000E731F18|nr:lysine--tRNA ligase [Citreicoccus inhibens]MBU8899188.1 lysine--tRNA ligase [Citreicoccus inhibens]RJS15261.1 lysine--tRNA ligase [Corallococcus sp. H22C18031201]
MDDNNNKPPVDKSGPEADLGSKEQEIYQQRLDKAAKWRDSGFNPYGNGYRPQHTAAEIVAKHADQSAEELEKAATAPYDVAGRIVAMRSFGKAAFIKLRDRTGEIQAHMKKDALGDAAYEVFKQCDVGDFLAVTGPIFRTKTNELSLSATKFTPLTKSLRPMPEKWHGLTDVEIRYRQRYLDLVSNPDVKQVFLRRNKLVRFIRNFLDTRDFIEVETPMMHPLVSGAAARPFRTHHNALDIDLYMRIAPELYLKRLVVGGFERVYEVNRNFRNEGVSTRHNPEFTMLEFYQAYATYEDLMDLTEQMISEAAVAVTGDSKVKYGEHVLDFGKGWKRISMVEAIREAVSGLSDKDMADPDRLRHELLKTSHAEAERRAVETMNHGELVGALFEHHVESTLIHPTFVTHFPTSMSPLARRNDANPEVTDRFELYAAGREIANAFSELNDPLDQKGRFLAQLDAKQRGQQETMDYDEDYIRALEHGMPPTAGEGIGIDRLAMLFTDAQSIRDVILFPLLKPLAK